MLGVDTENYFRQVLEHAHNCHDPYDLILVSGDLTQNPCPSSYQRIAAGLGPYQTQCLCLPGNHDDALLMDSFLNSGNIGCGKLCRLGHWQLFCLNSQIPGQAGGFLAETELELLETGLNNNPELFAIVALHHPCLPTGSAWLDTMMLANARDFFELLERHPQVKAVTCGHIHQEMDIIQQSMRFLATPSTCFQFKRNCRDFTLDTAMPGYRIIELFPNGDLSTQVQRLPGKFTELDVQSDSY